MGFKRRGSALRFAGPPAGHRHEAFNAHARMPAGVQLYASCHTVCSFGLRARLAAQLVLRTVHVDMAFAAGRYAGQAPHRVRRCHLHCLCQVVVAGRALQHLWGFCAYERMCAAWVQHLLGTACAPPP